MVTSPMLPSISCLAEPRGDLTNLCTDWKGMLGSDASLVGVGWTTTQKAHDFSPSVYSLDM